MLIDPNIFLEILLKQERSGESKQFLEKIRKGEICCYISDFNIDSILIILEKRTKSTVVMENFISSILEYRGLSIYFVTIGDRLKALEHMENYGLDFEDSLTLQAAISSGCSKIVSFDRDFDGLQIGRVEPKDLI